MMQNGNIPKGTPFKVPENYFSELNNRILDTAMRAEPVEEKPVKVFTLRRLIAVAASVTVVIGLGISALLLMPGRVSNDDLSEVIIYTESYFNGIDLLTLEETVVEKGSFLDITGVTNNDLIDYLVQEDINENDIIEKF
jgi:hypothetical protein